MTATVLTRDTPPSGPVVPDVVRSEWTKLRSVRSTWITIVVAAALFIGLGALISLAYVSRYDHLSVADKLRFDPTSFSLGGLGLAQLAFGVLGVLVVTSEFSTGLVRTTFAAVPQRRAVLAAKGLVFAVVTLVVGEISAFAAFFAGQSVLAGKHIQAHLGQPGVLRAVIGAGLYVGVVSLFALGIGTILRHTAGSIAALFGLLLVLPGVVQALPSSWQNTIAPYLPSNAGADILNTVHRGAHDLAPWTGFAVLCIWAAAALALGTYVLSRRDV